jgi:hypothetical protein
MDEGSFIVEAVQPVVILAGITLSLFLRIVPRQEVSWL